MPQAWEFKYDAAVIWQTYEEQSKAIPVPGFYDFKAQQPPGYEGTNYPAEALEHFPINPTTCPEFYNKFPNKYDQDETTTYYNQTIPNIDYVNKNITQMMDEAGPFHVKNPSLATVPTIPTNLNKWMLPAYGETLLGLPVKEKALPFETDTRAIAILDGLLSLQYYNNGINSLPFVQVTTKRVFLPILKNKKSVGTKQTQKQALAGMRTVLGAPMTASVVIHVNEAAKTAMLKPFPIAVAPDKIAIAQRSTRYVYGPWISNVDTLIFRGKVEYEQDDNLLPENFLIPTNFGEFGDFRLRQISGTAGLDLAAQAKANAIDDFALFAQEQGSISIQGAPAIKRIGDSLYGIRNVTDIKVNVSNAALKTSYSFKTISPRFGKNNADIEKKLTKISNKVKQIKLV